MQEEEAAALSLPQTPCAYALCVSEGPLAGPLATRLVAGAAGHEAGGGCGGSGGGGGGGAGCVEWLKAACTSCLMSQTLVA